MSSYGREDDRRLWGKYRGRIPRILLPSSAPSDEAADWWSTGAAKRGARLMRRSATCAVGLAASCPTLRSGSPVPERSVLPRGTENQLTLSPVGMRRLSLPDCHRKTRVRIPKRDSNPCFLGPPG